MTRLKGRHGFVYKTQGHWHYKSYQLATKPQWIKWYQIPSYLLFKGN